MDKLRKRIVDRIQQCADEAFDPETATDSDGIDQAQRNAYLDAAKIVEEHFSIHEQLEYLRGELRAQRISYEELAQLQSLAKYIAPDDVELLEAAGAPEFEEDGA